MKISQNDSFFMDYAIRLASRNLGNTGENPSVGCVITSENKIISIGVTGRSGSPHAEFNAINNIKNFPKNTKVICKRWQEQRYSCDSLKL